MSDRARDIVEGRVTRERSCDGKMRIRTPEYAEKIARRLSEQYQREQSYYFCAFCACYHLYTTGRK